MHNSLVFLLLFGVGAIASRSLAENHVGGSVVELLATDHRLTESDEGHTQIAEEADDQFCFDPVYRKRTLKLVKESPFIGLFHDLKGQTRFEASGINIAQGAVWAIFDNLRTMGKISLDFKFMGTENVLISEEGEAEAESQFEGLAYMPKSDTFIVVRETFVKKTLPDDSDDDETVHELLLSQTEELKISHGSFSVVRKCTIEFEFEDVNKVSQCFSQNALDAYRSYPPYLSYFPSLTRALRACLHLTTTRARGGYWDCVNPTIARRSSVWIPPVWIQVMVGWSLQGSSRRTRVTSGADGRWRKSSKCPRRPFSWTIGKKFVKSQTMN